MSEAAAPNQKSTRRTLYMAVDMGNSRWELGLTPGPGQSPRRVKVSAGDLGGLDEAIRSARKRFGLSGGCRVVSCYEAGRDGFWLHRFLEKLGVENRVVDPSSVPRSGRRRVAKTDRLDVRKLLGVLMRLDGGEADAAKVVVVPSCEAEDGRELGRELQTLKKERTQHRNRIQSLLIKEGVRECADSGFGKRLETVRLWDGRPLGRDLKSRLLRELARLELVSLQIKELEAERARRLKEEDSESLGKVRALMDLRGLGINGSWLFTMECFAWREYRNRREAASLIGITGTPFDSGDRSRDQGISKWGNGRVRAMLIEIAWCWVRYQRESALTQKFLERSEGGRRARRIAIVALARQLWIDLWRYVEYGIIPEGAELKSE